MVNLDSDLHRAHPDWVLGVPGRLPPTWRGQQVLDLTVPEACDHVLGRLDALLSDNDIAYLKWDHNRDLVEAADRDGRPAVHAQTLAVYRLLDALRERHPEVEIESCSSGGARVDLGILERTDRVWASDANDALERQAHPALDLPAAAARAGRLARRPAARAHHRPMGRVVVPRGDGAVRLVRLRVGPHHDRRGRAGTAPRRRWRPTSACDRCCTRAGWCTATCPTRRRCCTASWAATAPPRCSATRS